MAKVQDKLTEEQWESLLEDFDSKRKTNPRLKQKYFLKDWCDRNGVTEYPHPATLSRQLQKREDKKRKPARREHYFQDCGHYVDYELLKSVKEKHGAAHIASRRGQAMCPNCVTRLSCQASDHAADVYIEHHMNNTKGPMIDWPDAMEVPKTHFATNSLPPALRCCPYLAQFLLTKILVRRIDVQKSLPSPKFLSCITGGKHPPHFEYTRDQVAHNPGDGSIGLLVFGEEDFAMIDTSGISNEAIYHISADESKSIAEKEMGKRQGVAGGRFHSSDNLDHDVKALSKATKQSRVLVASKESSQSTRLDAFYVNYDYAPPTVINWPSIYNDVLMKRLKSTQKLRAALFCPYLREKYIEEMKSRLRAYCVMDHFGFKNDYCCHWISFTSAVDSICNGGGHEKWQAAVPGMCHFEMVLLEWCCSTGEMRNHQALSVHTDANRSHPLETMQVFGRLDPTKSHLGKTRQVQEFHDAMLCVLWQMIGLQIRCGRDVWHLSFRNTHHLPDRTRDRFNFSWVHGP